MAADRIAMIKATLKYTSQADLIEAMRPLISTRGLFIRTRTTRPVGSEVRFEFKLADGSVTYAGEGIVRKEIPFVGGPSSQGSGMLIALRKINRPFKEVVDVVIGAQRKSDRDVTPSAMPAVKVPEAKGADEAASGRMIVDSKKADDGLDLFGELDMDEGLDFLFSGIGKKEGVKPVEESHGFARLKVVSDNEKPGESLFDDLGDIEFGDIEAEDFDVESALKAAESFTDLPPADVDIPDVAETPVQEEASTIPPDGGQTNSAIDALFAAVEKGVEDLLPDALPEAPSDAGAVETVVPEAAPDAVVDMSSIGASEPVCEASVDEVSASENEGASAGVTNEATAEAEAAAGPFESERVAAGVSERLSDTGAESASETEMPGAENATISEVIAEEGVSLNATASNANASMFGDDALSAGGKFLTGGGSAELGEVINKIPVPKLDIEPIFAQPSQTLVGMPNQGISEEFLSKPALDANFLSKPALSEDFLSKPVEFSAEIPKAEVRVAEASIEQATVSEAPVEAQEAASEPEPNSKGVADSYFSEMLVNSSDTLSKVVEAESPSEVFEALRGDFLEQNAHINDGQAQTVSEAIAETTAAHSEHEEGQPAKALFSELNGSQGSTSTSGSLIDNLVNGTPEKTSDEVKPATISQISNVIASQGGGELPHVQSRLSRIPVAEKEEDEGISLNSLSSSGKGHVTEEAPRHETRDDDGLSLNDLMKQQERVNVGSQINDSFSKGINLASMPRKERKTFDSPSVEADMPSRKKGFFGRIFGK